MKSIKKELISYRDVGDRGRKGGIPRKQERNGIPRISVSSRLNSLDRNQSKINAARYTVKKKDV